MKTTIKSPNIEIIESIRKYIEKKVDSFERPIERYLTKQEDIDKNPIESRKERVESFWEIGTESSGIKKGLFFCKVQITMPGKSRHLIAQAESGDMHDAIDQVKDMIMSQIVEVKEKPVSVKKRAARRVKRDLLIDPAAKNGEGDRVRDESA